MAPSKQEVHDRFESKPSEAARERRLSSFTLKKKPNVQAFSSLTPMWAGIAGQTLENNTKFEIGTLSRVRSFSIRV
jgi:alpha,alpha-trehalose phosphorylase (configuration-retaining)